MQIGLSIEKDLVARIDALARRDQITRSTWIREALISAWKRAEEFKRTPIHGYIATPIEVISARAAEEPEQTPKRQRKA